MYNELIQNRIGTAVQKRVGFAWTASYQIRFYKYSKKQVASKVLDSIIEKWHNNRHKASTQNTVSCCLQTQDYRCINGLGLWLDFAAYSFTSERAFNN